MPASSKARARHPHGTALASCSRVWRGSGVERPERRTAKALVVVTGTSPPQLNSRSRSWKSSCWDDGLLRWVSRNIESREFSRTIIHSPCSHSQSDRVKEKA